MRLTANIISEKVLDFYDIDKLSDYFKTSDKKDFLSFAKTVCEKIVRIRYGESVANEQTKQKYAYAAHFLYSYFSKLERESNTNVAENETENENTKTAKIFISARCQYYLDMINFYSYNGMLDILSQDIKQYLNRKNVTEKIRDISRKSYAIVSEKARI